MMKQYLEIKKDYPDAILFYRMGDFYEMFFQDAETAAPVLEIALTSRNRNDDFPVPMCGIPCRAGQGYIARLIDRGFKVAICEQMEDASQSKGLVKREVVRVITPGMILENELLEEKSNNFILAVTAEGDVVGLSSLDISTADFRVMETRDMSAMIEEADRISPREILISEAMAQKTEWQPFLTHFSSTFITRLKSAVFGPDAGRERMIQHFNTLSLEGFGCEAFRAGIGAAAALLAHVENTQKQSLAHIRKIETYTLSDFLIIDDNSRRNLELMQNLQNGDRLGSLLNVLDQTVTAMGARLLKLWIQYPLRNKHAICLRQDAVAEALVQIQTAREIREILKQVVDLERISIRIVMARCTPRDVLALGASLKILPHIMQSVHLFQSGLYRKSPVDDLADMNALSDLIERSIRDDAPLGLHEGGLIKAGFNSELDELIQISSDGKSWLARLEMEEKRATGINSLKVRYNRVFGYYIEIPRSQSSGIPDHYIRKQTLVNAERYITEDLKQFEMKITGAEERRAELEYRLFQDICKEIQHHHARIQQVAEFVARLDCLLNLAVIADQNAYTRPEINENGIIQVDDGRHPVIEKMIQAERFTPNSLFMDNTENQIMIITGPNMAGKSTVLRQTALHVLMAQMGSFIPARNATICITDRIFTRVGALDNLASGQSTFLVEMQETANILHNATPISLVIMDEIGRGTSTYDGFSIAWAVVCFLHDLKGYGVKTLFATHYHELTEVEKLKPRVKNFNIAVKEKNDEIIFLRKLLKGGTNRSYGIQVARLAGIPDTVINHAHDILNDIESGRRRFTGISKAGVSSCRSAHEQLRLFKHPENPALERLRTLDIINMTPLESLNCLNELFMLVKRNDSGE
jgi:DNA mismatch repair protein MutS